MYCIVLYQKPIRVETCNARSQLPNIQCELIGWMFQCKVPYLETPCSCFSKYGTLQIEYSEACFPAHKGPLHVSTLMGFWSYCIVLYCKCCTDMQGEIILSCAISMGRCFRSLLSSSSWRVSTNLVPRVFLLPFFGAGEKKGRRETLGTRLSLPAFLDICVDLMIKRWLLTWLPSSKAIFTGHAFRANNS